MNNKKFIPNIFYGVVYLISLLPIKFLYLFSDLLYLLGWKIFRYRKNVVIQNLARSFPNVKYHQIDKLADEYAKNLFSIMGEWLKSLSETKKEIQSRIVFDNKEIIDNKGNIFLVLGHYANWEILNVFPLITNKVVYAVYKKQSSSFADMICKKMRSRFGLRLLEMKKAAYYIAKNSIPSIYIIIADQSPASTSKMLVNFLNQPTLVFNGVERLAKLTNGTVFYTEIIIRGRGKYSVVFKKCPDDKNITRFFFYSLEQTIKKQPQYWLWSHRRWKLVAVQ